MNRNFGVSVIIPFRNEAEHLPQIIAALEGQNVVTQNVEVIWVDDASEDNGTALVKHAVDRNYGWKYLYREGIPGKKAALHTGIVAARFDNILTTDADCTMGDSWIANAMQLLQDHLATEIFILPVIVGINQSEMSHWQNIESIQLLALSRITSAMHYPVLCSGANLMFKRSFYESTLSLRGDLQIASGDDLFLLEQAREARFFGRAELKVITSPAENWKSFIQQRVRWFGKVRKLKRARFFIIGGLVSIWQFAIPLMFLLTVLNQWSFSMLILLVLIKWLLDLSLQYFISTGLQQRFDCIRGLAFSLFYPLMQCIILSAGLFIKPLWKGRFIQS